MYIAHRVPGRYMLYPWSRVQYLEKKEETLIRITDYLHIVSESEQDLT